jgi:PAS domain S-box-containing protein
MKLRHKILLLSLLPLALILLVAGVGHWVQGAKSLRTSAFGLLESELDRAAGFVSNFVGVRLAELETIARMDVVRRGGVSEIIALLAEEQVRGRAHYEALYYCDKAGVVYDNTGGSFGLRSWDFFPLVDRGETVVTRVLSSRTSGNPLVILMVPVLDASGRRIATIGASVLAQGLLDELSQSRLGVSGFALVASEGEVVMSGNAPTRWLDDKGEFNPLGETQDSSLVRLAETMSSADRGKAEIDLEDRAFVAVFRRVDGVAKWRIAIAGATDELLAPMSWMKGSAVAFPIVLVIVLLLMSYALRQTLEKPLERLTETLLSFGRGDVEVRAQTGSSGELGTLERSFNSMADLVTRELLANQEAQRALSESEHQYRSLVELSPMPIFVHRDGKFVYLNPAAMRMHGAIATDELIGVRLLELVHPDYRDSFQRSLAHDAHVPFQTTLKICRLDGTIVDVEATRIAVRFQGAPALLVICTDVTERNKLADSQHQIEIQVQHAQKLESLAALAGGIAHDFNNTLATILGNADLALMELPPEANRQRPGIERIRAAARRASELTNQLLAYSGKGKFVVDLVDLGDLIQDMSALLEVSVSPMISIHFDLAHAAPPVLGDLAQLRQLIVNLVNNAAEAIGEGPGDITISLRPSWMQTSYASDFSLNETLPPGAYTSIVVRDTGAGMDAQTRKRIFDPFFTTKFPGRGLGLAAVMGIVRGHGGAVKVYSEPGQGTTFEVLLPRAEGKAKMAPSLTPRPVEEESFGGGTVLLVDDEPEVRSVAQRMLLRYGYTVHEAADGLSALRCYEQRQSEIDVVLLDMMMPGMRGDEVLTKLRTLDPKVRVVLFSGYSEQDLSTHFDDQMPDAFVQKPFTVKKLIDAVRGVQLSIKEPKN